MSTIELDVTAMAHGGHAVARHEGRVVFVRHAIPGERVRAVVTQGREKDSFWRADVTDVLEPSEHRVPPAWADAGAGRVGAAEFQHIELGHQRHLKAEVVRDAWRKMAGMDINVTVGVPPYSAGWGWRQRITVVATDSGLAGMRAHRSHDLIELSAMPLAVPALEAAVIDAWFTPGAVVHATIAGDVIAMQADGQPWRGSKADRSSQARSTVVHHITVDDRELTYRVPIDGFWQVHVDAAAVLAQRVCDLAGEPTRVADLYGGVGLFALALAHRGHEVVTVESSELASRAARRNLHDHATVSVVTGEVGAVLRRDARDGTGPATSQVVVLDPPRTGAGKAIVTALARSDARRIIYVACDPVALARDGATFAQLGFGLTSVEAWDLFPMTHHVECIAVFDPSTST